MTISSILGFVAVAGVLMLLGGAALAVTSATQGRPPRSGLVLAVAGLVIAVLFGIASLGVIVVGATEVAVVFQSVGGNGATNNLWPVPLGPGVHIVVPIINEPYIYSTEIHNYTMSKTANEGAVGGDDSVQVRTKDGQLVYIDVSVLYGVDATNVNNLHLKYKGRYEEDFVRPTVRSIVRDVVSGYAVEDLYGSLRTELENKCNDQTATAFKDSGLFLKSLLIRNITFSDEFIKAVEAKQVSAQQAEQAKLEADRARTLAQGQADAAVTKAKGDADSTIEKAKGDAESIKLNAAAQAQALALINEQLSKNPLLIQWQYVQKLASNISLILVPTGSPFLFNTQSLIGGQTGTGTSSTGPTAPTPPGTTSSDATPTPQPTP